TLEPLGQRLDQSRLKLGAQLLPRSQRCLQVVAADVLARRLPARLAHAMFVHSATPDSKPPVFSPAGERRSQTATDRAGTRGPSGSRRTRRPPPPPPSSQSPRARRRR